MKTFILVIPLILIAYRGQTQGCVAIRNVDGINPGHLFNKSRLQKQVVINITNRYFDASSTFKGNKYTTDTLVTNRIFTLNISVLKILNNGWSLSLNIPVSANSRNNGADHKGPGTLPRYTTRSFGLGDIRFTVYKWLTEPDANKKWNVQAGLGIKLPTGDYRYEDYFVRNDSTKVLAPVDQAIQLGDGGTGLTGELSIFYSINKKITLFTHGFYLLNPREQNGVSNLKGRNATALQVKNNTTVMSVPDQFSIRGGANFEFKNVIVTTGIRYEKVPVNDLIGGNKGFRRAASILTVEPGIVYNLKGIQVFANVGIPVKRNIVLNTENDLTPAGFADMIFYLGGQFKLF